MLSEFDLIARYFTRLPRTAGPVRLGVGDDCALLTPSVGTELAVSTDMLVEGRHFFPDADPFQLGHKCLAVNLSDLAAMGAKPLAFTLALALPAVDETWLAAFSQGMLALADLHGIELVGGDTTKGPLTICLTVMGEVPSGAALRRDAARAGDDLWVSGSLGDARLALSILQNTAGIDASLLALCAPRLHQPEPRVALGLALRGIAHAAIDVSDGLLGDLGHVLKRSKVGAVINADALPAGVALSTQPVAMQREFALNGGDDYELCFTAPLAQRDAVLAAAQTCGTAISRIGRITSDHALVVIDSSGATIPVAVHSFDHFTHP
jgi:thiamine-monophosphate kinase